MNAPDTNTNVMDEKDERIEQWERGKYNNKSRFKSDNRNRNERGRSVLKKRGLHKTDRDTMKTIIKYITNDTDVNIPCQISIAESKQYRYHA